MGSAYVAIRNFCLNDYYIHEDKGNIGAAVEGNTNDCNNPNFDTGDTAASAYQMGFARPRWGHECPSLETPSARVL